MDTIEIENFISVFAVLVSLSSLILSIGVALYKRKTTCARAVTEFLTIIWNSDDILRTLYEIDYGKFKYSKDFHHNLSDDTMERRIDKTLIFFNHICQLRDRGLIATKDFRLLEYYIDILISDANVQDYMYNLKHWGEYDVFIFDKLKEYGIKTGKIEELSFDDKNYHLTQGAKYHHYL